MSLGQCPRTSRRVRSVMAARCTCPQVSQVVRFPAPASRTTHAAPLEVWHVAVGGWLTLSIHPVGTEVSMVSSLSGVNGLHSFWVSWFIYGFPTFWIGLSVTLSLHEGGDSVFLLSTKCNDVKNELSIWHRSLICAVVIQSAPAVCKRWRGSCALLGGIGGVQDWDSLSRGQLHPPAPHCEGGSPSAVRSSSMGRLLLSEIFWPGVWHPRTRIVCSIRFCPPTFYRIRDTTKATSVEAWRVDNGTTPEVRRSCLRRYSGPHRPSYWAAACVKWLDSFLASTAGYLNCSRGNITDAWFWMFITEQTNADVI